MKYDTKRRLTDNYSMPILERSCSYQMDLSSSGLGRLPYKEKIGDSTSSRSTILHAMQFCLVRMVPFEAKCQNNKKVEGLTHDSS